MSNRDLKPANVIVAMVRVKTTSVLNRERTTSMGARMAQATRSRRQKESAYNALRGAIAEAKVQPGDLLPAVVTLVRQSTGKLDDDNLRGALKHVRDGIAHALCIDDGSRFVRFRYAQRKAKRGDFGVEVRIEKGVFRKDVARRAAS